MPRSFSLSRREADVAITVERPDHGRLVAARLVDYALGLYASKAYLEAKGMPQTEADLASHNLIGYVEDLVAAQSLNYGPEFFGSAKPNFSVSSALGQLEAVRSGAGIGILHRFIARAHPELVQVLPQKSLTRAYFIAYHESMRTLRRITAVTHFIAEIVEREKAVFS